MAKHPTAEPAINFRALYGKLFSGLLHHFGTDCISEIEDAIQHAFLKSLKHWKPEQLPVYQENWLFIVARNNVLNQLKQKKLAQALPQYPEQELDVKQHTDLRLQTILLVAGFEQLSVQAKILFVLKNIFGLSIAEIADSTLLQQEAIYKSINRTKKSLQLAYAHQPPDVQALHVLPENLPIVEEMLYAVFNIGFDSFNEKVQGIVNEDLCIEAISLAKLLLQQYQLPSSSNLLALFCFHVARIPAKVTEGKLVAFFEQDRSMWNPALVQLGFHYLRQPAQLSRFYLEALIVSKYMTSEQLGPNDWAEIAQLYSTLLRVSNSPIVQLNYSFCLGKLGKMDEALALFAQVESQLPPGHLYCALVKASLLKPSDPEASNAIFTNLSNKMNQPIRQAFLLENNFINL